MKLVLSHNKLNLQDLCYHNTFVSAIIHNTFATIPLSTNPIPGYHATHAIQMIHEHPHYELIKQHHE